MDLTRRPAALPNVRSPLRDASVAARVGRILGVAIAVCFVTGLVSHLHQHPVGWLPVPATPVWGYRVTQGLHVAAGLACIPLVLVKLFSVYPRLFEWPPVRSAGHALERLSVAVLVGGMLFELASGVANVAQWYPWPFYFPAAHWAVAWALAGAVLVHLAVKWPVIADALRWRLDDQPVEGLTRRGLLVGTAAAVGAVTLTTVGQTLPGLSRLALLSPRRPGIGPQHLPVNRSASAAGIHPGVTGASWRLVVAGPTPLALTLDDLATMPQHTVELPIACVEGWSASATWSGVRLADLLARAGIAPAQGVRVHSLEPVGLYRSSTLNPTVARHRDTLLATHVNGEPLHVDHGFPLRLVAPDRPGVLQTKWLARIEPLA